MDKTFLFLKLQKGNRKAKYWLQLDGNTNPYEKPAAVIYFGKFTTKEYKYLCKLTSEEYNDLYNKIVKENKSKKREFEKKDIPKYTDFRDQIRPFFEAGERRNAKFLTIFDNKAILYEPDSEVFNGKELENDIQKIMFVKNMKIKSFKEIPHVLRTLTTNGYLIHGTCRKIDPEKNWGAIQAIKICLTNEKIDIPKKLSAQKMISLLSFLELETLIFLILTNAGIYSPAWRAGNLPKIDIIGINYSSKKIEIGDSPKICFGTSNEDRIKTFQVKRGVVKSHSKYADYTVAINYDGKKEKKDKILTAEWILNVVKTQPKTQEWIENSLEWYKKAIGVKSIFQILE